MTASPFEKCKNWLRHASYLTEEDCDLFEDYLTARQYKAGDFVLQNGSVCHEMGFVNSGAFRIYYLSDDKEINTRFCFEGEFVVDYDSFLEQKPSRYFIQALEDSEMVTFTLPTLLEAYKSSQNWERFGRMMAEESFKMVTRRVESFMFMTGEQRYLQLLENQPEIFQKLPLYHIASYLGLERESLSRIRKKMATK